MENLIWYYFYGIATHSLDRLCACPLGLDSARALVHWSAQLGTTGHKAYPSFSTLTLNGPRQLRRACWRSVWEMCVDKTAIGVVTKDTFSDKDATESDEVAKKRELGSLVRRAIEFDDLMITTRDDTTRGSILYGGCPCFEAHCSWREMALSVSSDMKGVVSIQVRFVASVSPSPCSLCKSETVPTFIACLVDLDLSSFVVLSGRRAEVCSESLPTACRALYDLVYHSRTFSLHLTRSPWSTPRLHAFARSSAKRQS